MIDAPMKKYVGGKMPKPAPKKPAPKPVKAPPKRGGY